MRPEMRHVTPTLEAETALWEEGYAYVAGLDEAGRGAWAGPVYAGAVILPDDLDASSPLRSARDSKQLTPKRREALFDVIEAQALAFGVGWADPAEIDQIGIVPATKLAMSRALEMLAPQPQALVIDALRLSDCALPQRSFPFADALSLSVAAASIVAKVSRDRWMCETAEAAFPGYGFAQHKGYGTRQHRTALASLGVSAIHRQTFRPVAQVIEKSGTMGRGGL